MNVNRSRRNVDEIGASAVVRIGRLSVVLGLAVAASLLGNSSAAAHPAEDCQSVHYNVEGWDNQDDVTSEVGVKSNMWVADAGDGTQCNHVSSLAVLNAGGVVEFGWDLGWSSSDGNLYTGPGACNDQYFSTDPHLLMAWVPIGGGYHCWNGDALLPGMFDAFWIHDTNQNTVWDADFISGPAVMSADVNFSTGEPITNGERHNRSDDTAHAEFKALSQQYYWDGSTWFDFLNSSQYADSDPDYNWVRIGDDHTEVIN